MSYSHIVRRSQAGESTQPPPHPTEKIRTNIAIAVAVFSAFFAGWQGYEAHRSRVSAQRAADAQARDVEESRKAAEQARLSAMKIAEANALMAKTQQETLELSRVTLADAQRQFHDQVRPYLEVASTHIKESGFPKLWDLNIDIRNTGRAPALNMIARCEVLSENLNAPGYLSANRPPPSKKLFEEGPFVFTPIADGTVKTVDILLNESSPF